MKWFKHEGNARGHHTIKKLLMKYGSDGYALYFYCVEIIAGNLASDNITFELEHDAEILASDLKMDTLRVEEIMKWMIGAGLFDMNTASGNPICWGLLKRLDNTLAQSKEIKKLLNDPNFKKLKETYRNFKDLKAEEKRLEEKRREVKKEYAPDVFLTEAEYERLIKEYHKSDVDSILEDLSNALSNKYPKNKYKNHSKTARNWLKIKGVKKRKPDKLCPDCKKPYKGSCCQACGWSE